MMFDPPPPTRRGLLCGVHLAASSRSHSSRRPRRILRIRQRRAIATSSATMGLPGETTTTIVVGRRTVVMDHVVVVVVVVVVSLSVPSSSPQREMGRGGRDKQRRQQQTTAGARGEKARQSRMGCRAATYSSTSQGMGANLARGMTSTTGTTHGCESTRGRATARACRWCSRRS